MTVCAISKITSYALPDNHTTASCCVLDITNPSVPRISLLNPSTPSGAIARHSSGRNPMTKFTPPVVVLGSRISEIADANSLHFFASQRSNSRYACEEVPRAKIPAWGVYMTAIIRAHPLALSWRPKIAEINPQSQWSHLLLNLVRISSCAPQPSPLSS